MSASAWNRYSPFVRFSEPPVPSCISLHDHVLARASPDQSSYVVFISLCVQENSGYKEALLLPFEADDHWDQLLTSTSMNAKKLKVTYPCA